MSRIPEKVRKFDTEISVVNLNWHSAILGLLVKDNNDSIETSAHRKMSYTGGPIKIQPVYTPGET